ncbi:MAG: putative toxin-antitoxin system toxin component, PIN family [Candidatus Competibacterales bacterium]|nr:putative toxin-antitoxin system toxin component, PIN family [Candidatus Competibacterales bacterium]
MSVPRVVLDTNCLISALLFSTGQLAWLREGWQAGRFIPLVSRDTVSELVRVLAYPKFRLDATDQESLLADFLPFAETVVIERPPENLPEPSDPDDRMFLELAVAAEADALVSGDAAILAMKNRPEQVSILAAGEFAEWLNRR